MRVKTECAVVPLAFLFCLVEKRRRKKKRKREKKREGVSRHGHNIVLSYAPFLPQLRKKKDGNTHTPLKFHSALSLEIGQCGKERERKKREKEEI